eukprot:TRINITY_DN5459_c0_g1_i1.p1 TRINITY_DN5459_c0_g1~~TRINITY_DN5459_c0_g1_i1.p1  ORF type:complete len:297 (+),score=114.22 TRINITY_DN5459_c0_g1_i1:136-1026(+)
MSSSEEETEEQRLEREHKRLLEHRKMREQKAKELAERKAKEAAEAAARAAARGEEGEEEPSNSNNNNNTKDSKANESKKEEKEEGNGDSIGERIMRGELIYCPTCGLPPEYCEWGPDFNKCKPWILKNCPQLYPKLAAAQAEKKADGKEEEKDEGKKKQKRGGKGQVKQPKEAENDDDDESKKVIISLAHRTARKTCTTVHNLEKFGVNLKSASQIFRKKFACGSNVVAEGAVEIQGAFGDDLIDLICEQEWGITEDDIEELEEGKKVKTRKKNTRPKGKKGGRSGAFPNPASNLN